MSVFPGSFTEIRLLNMDVRDFEMWFIEAQKIESVKRIRNVNDLMLAMGAVRSKKGYRQYKIFFAGEKFLIRELENLEKDE